MDNLGDVIIENEGLIYKIIDKYRNYFELEDLYQVGVIGLIKASKTYNREYGTKFTSYAYPFILGEVIKYIN
jgi:RNA polymerase sporulation-specific sigma factor